jgi:hypothetical protein
MSSTAQRSPASPLSRLPAASAALWNFATEARVGAGTLPPQLAALRFPGLGENCYKAAMNEIVCERDGEELRELPSGASWRNRRGMTLNL